MAQIIGDVSRTFNEFLLLPNLTDERCIPSNVSLKTPLVKFFKKTYFEFSSNVILLTQL